LGVLFVKRECPHSGARVLKTALRALRRGTRVLTFPEGTTSDGSKLLPFKLGAFALARLADVPVVPIAVRLPRPVCWHGNAAFLPHYLRSIARHDVPVELEVGRALRPTPGLSDEDMAQIIRTDLSAMLADRQDEAFHNS
ncbi:MAG: 1-acyl-sn-glycerol-3-phosphate acyltransferase, partial [Myxococcales bacterium]|nr:1-acyl-sn-glycerol-3-phosphate acyltransferase [Myxococcales bacterium]